MTRPRLQGLPLLPAALAAALLLGAVALPAQSAGGGPILIRKTIAEVDLNVAVTNRKGRYVTGLRPKDFEITEDGIPENIATFEEGNAPPLTLAASPNLDTGRTALQVTPQAMPGVPAATTVTGASVFVLMDTSNYMFEQRGFVYAQNAIIHFVEALNPADRVAFYSYSRDLSRETPLTSNRAAVVRGVRATVNGDAAALYNSLLLTLRDAAHVPGRKVIVVFSNGPDSASVVPPEYVGQLAQSEGIPIYVVSTRHAEASPATAHAMVRLSADTGGETFFARHWQDESVAFRDIGEDLKHLYFLTYYPKPNPNHGWRTIHVTLRGAAFRKDRIRTRSGYQPLPATAAGNPR